VTRGRQKSLLALVESKLSECCRWLESVRQTQAEQPVTTDYEQQLALIQVTVHYSDYMSLSCTMLSESLYYSHN